MVQNNTTSTIWGKNNTISTIWGKKLMNLLFRAKAILTRIIWGKRKKNLLTGAKTILYLLPGVNITLHLQFTITKYLNHYKQHKLNE